MGAWIETLLWESITVSSAVASYMGAWIETLSFGDASLADVCRILHGCVD